MPLMRLIEMRWRLRTVSGATLECRIHRVGAYEYEVRMGVGDEIAYAETTGELGSARYCADVLKKAMLIEHPGCDEVAPVEAV